MLDSLISRSYFFPIKVEYGYFPSSPLILQPLFPRPQYLNCSYCYYGSYPEVLGLWQLEGGGLVRLGETGFRSLMDLGSLETVFLLSATFLVAESFALSPSFSSTL